MDVADGGGDPLNERLASCLGILVSLDQFLQSVPTAFGAVEVDDLEPARLTCSLPLIIPCSSAPTLSNNIIQKGLAFGRDWSGSVVNSGR